MADPKFFVWKGPPTAVEVWAADPLEAGARKEPLLSERATLGKTFSVAIDPDHPAVKG